MPNQEHERERERDQTHSYWYIPSAPRVNYSLLVMESAGMMKMATGEGSTLWQGAGTGSREVFGGYRGLRRRNSRSRLFSGGFSIYRIFWRRSHVRGVSGLSTRQGPTPRGAGRAPHPCGKPGTLLAQLFYSGVFFWSLKNRQKLARQLDSVWYSFSVKLKTRKNRNWHWALG